MLSFITANGPYIIRRKECVSNKITEAIWTHVGASPHLRGGRFIIYAQHHEVEELIAIMKGEEGELHSALQALQMMEEEESLL